MQSGSCSADCHVGFYKFFGNCYSCDENSFSYAWSIVLVLLLVSMWWMINNVLCEWIDSLDVSAALSVSPHSPLILLVLKQWVTVSVGWFTTALLLFLSFAQMANVRSVLPRLTIRLLHDLAVACCGARASAGDRRV
jgi:hypothetical protein